MDCQKCNAANPVDAKFCMNCGNSLILACPNCSQVNPPLAKYCIECGHELKNSAEEKREPYRGMMPQEYEQKLETARKAQTMQGERRIVSILFCDVKGSTSMAEQMDPEEWAEIMNQAFEYLIAPIYEYEGTLARLMGDSVLAFFGAPIAHEDDARRAVLAGMKILNSIQPLKDEIKQKYNQNFDVRVGINTGLVVVGGVGSDLFMEYTALGDAINIAARMEQTAQPGTIQIWEDTHKLVAPFFETELVDGLKIKGKTESGQVYRITGKKDGQDKKRGLKGFDAPLTGRSDELLILKQAISSVEKGRGQIVCLIGEAGLGKSRLVREVQQVWELTNTGSQPFGKLLSRWNQTSGVSYEMSRPYGLIQRLIRNFIGAASSDTPGSIRKHLLDALSINEVSVSPEQINLFEILLGVSESEISSQLSGEELKRAIFKEMLTILEFLSSEGPTVICIDDLHWSDPASAELILHLFQLADRLPILFLCAFRPDRSSPAWNIKQQAETDFTHRFSEISLTPLPANESSALVDQLLVGYQVPKNIRELILRKSDGNPFFMEEVVRTLIDTNVVEQDPVSGNWQVISKIEDIAIPDNLQSLFAARIDKLEESTKHVLQMASVIGRTFYQQVLSWIDDGSTDLDLRINQLQRLGLIQETEREPYLEFTFRLALTQETAYHTILLKNRREFHKKVAEAILQLYPERINEYSSVLGHHLYQAQDPRAVQYLRIEGDSALNLYANEEAIASYTKAIEAAGWETATDLERLIYFFLKRGRAYELNSQFSAALNNYRELERIAKDAKDKPVELTALVAQAQIRSIPSTEFNTEVGLKIVEKAKEIAEEFEDQQALAKILWIEMNLHRFHEGLLAAQKIGEKAILLARELGMEEQLAYSLNDTAHVYSMNGQISRAREVSIEAVDLWRKLENKPMLADSLSGLATISVYVGNFDEAYQYSDEAYQISESIGNVWGQSYSRYGIGLVDLERGNISTAINISLQSLKDADRSNFMAGSLLGRSFLSLIYTEAGDDESAKQVIQEAVDKTNQGTEIVNAISVGASLLAAVKAGRLKEAEDIIKNYTTPKNNPHIIARYYYVVAECYLYLAQGKYEEAEKRAKEFNAQLQKSGVRFLNAEMLMISSLAQSKLGEFQAAHQSLNEAAAAAQEIGSRRILWQIYFYLGQFEQQHGSIEKAQEYFSLAEEIISYITDQIESPEKKNLFLAREEIKSLHQMMDLNPVHDSHRRR